MYQYREITISEGKSKYKDGFTRLNKILLNDEFISYKNENTGKYFVISNSGGNEYVCTGSCFCDDVDNRRTASVLTRGINIFLSALTISVAINMANSVFHDSCIDQFSDICDLSKIRSVLEGCDDDDIIPDDEDYEETEEYEDIDEVEFEEDDTIPIDTVIPIRGRGKEYADRIWREYDILNRETKDRQSIDEEVHAKFECWGECFKNDYFDPMNSEMLLVLTEGEPTSEIKCDDLEFSGIEEISAPRETQHKELKFIAEKKFARIQLQRFCLDSSMSYLKRGYSESRGEEILKLGNSLYDELRENLLPFTEIERALDFAICLGARDFGMEMGEFFGVTCIRLDIPDPI